jgi:sporulation-control protein
MFNKFLSKVGIGAAKVDTVLHNSEVVRGEYLEGEIRMVGGKNDQEINKVYLELYTYYTYETENGESTASFVLHRLDIDEGFTLRAGEEVVYDFELEVPLVTPLTFGHTRVNLKTGLDVAWAFDPKDNDPVQVFAEPATDALLMAAEALGFEHDHHSGDCFEMQHIQGVPYVQEFSFKGRGAIGQHVEELEMIISANENEVAVLMEVDKRNRGFRGHMMDALDLDERHIRFSLAHDMEFSAEDLEGIIHEALGH